MAYRKTTTAAAAKTNGRLSSVSPTSSASSGNPPSLPPAVILSPCAACKILRRRCVENCLLAPYFPPTERSSSPPPTGFSELATLSSCYSQEKFRRFFFLSCRNQELPEDQRADAVNSIVYEANARLRDPVYGCTGMICHLQNQVSELQAEVAKAQAEILNMQCQNASLLDLLCKGLAGTQNVDENLPYDQNSTFFSDEANVEFLGTSLDMKGLAAIIITCISWRIDYSIFFNDAYEGKKVPRNS
ncbi:UNVERIFIED_CONTAM: LOB domain-containing protein 1 [Sesamum latifolium]|uniref:LOB domain-containing protein 1 n=1 Tax=Sesamum latifolium TaxID=2727402 RepID=A0AAW2XDN8_9LAMI